MKIEKPSPAGAGLMITHRSAMAAARACHRAADGPIWRRSVSQRNSASPGPSGRGFAFPDHRLSRLAVDEGVDAGLSNVLPPPNSARCQIAAPY